MASCRHSADKSVINNNNNNNNLITLLECVPTAKEPIIGNLIKAQRSNKIYVKK
jgi:hypothetical protein